MNRFENYNPIILPTYRYATIPCDTMFINENFDNVLKAIGKFYFHKPEAGLNSICTMIRDEINKEWNLNGFKRRVRLKRVSTTQIKTIRRAFIRISNNNTKFVRIPFDVVSILFFIITLLNKIAKLDKTGEGKACAQAFFKEMNRERISVFLYREHMELFEANYVRRRNQLTDDVLIEKYELLYANLLGQYSIMQQMYSQINWNNDTPYIIK